MKKKRFRPAFPAPEHSLHVLVTLLPEHVALFRFLLEAHDNLALFTVLDRHQALLKVLFSPHQARDVQNVLASIAESVPLKVHPWPVARSAS